MKIRTQIINQWDRNAIARCRQLQSGKDISHDKVLAPSLLRLAGNLEGKRVLDAGCGCGFLTARIARSAKSVVGVDISRQMIEEARRRFGDLQNVRFEVGTIEALVGLRRERFDVCLSNMALMTMPHLDRALHGIYGVLRQGGQFAFSITHPCFWNSYRKDERMIKFDYWTPHAVTAPFRITLARRPLPVPTTYFHRPASTYVGAIVEAGFQVDRIDEPRPPVHAPARYRRGFRFPRFMVFLCLKKGKRRPLKLTRSTPVRCR